MDALGNVYIADTGNNIIRKVDPSGTITLFAGTPTQSGYSGNNQAANKALLSSPTQVATDLAGNVYILDSGNNVIRKVDGSGIITTYAGGGIGGVGTTSAPATDVSIQAVGIATDLAGNLYIATGSSVYVVDPNQNISLLVGEGSSQASGIPATQTSLGATAVAVDASGDLFVNDATDYMIYEVGPYGDLVFGAGREYNQFHARHAHQYRRCGGYVLGTYGYRRLRHRFRRKLRLLLAGCGRQLHRKRDLYAHGGRRADGNHQHSHQYSQHAQHRSVVRYRSGRDCTGLHDHHVDSHQDGYPGGRRRDLYPHDHCGEWFRRDNRLHPQFQLPNRHPMAGLDHHRSGRQPEHHCRAHLRSLAERGFLGDDNRHDFQRTPA